MDRIQTPFSTPILFVIFNRPDTTERVFESIKKIRPSRLFIAADGARPDKEGESKLCEQTRTITESIDWPCEVKRKYSDTNRGSKLTMSDAITWFFENVEEGIILEDDCLPDRTFYHFCEELLSKYRNEDSVKMISGNNFQFGKKYGNESYYFSRLPSIWGWATWRRAWQAYDIDMKSFPAFKQAGTIKTMLQDKAMQKFMMGLFEKVYKNEMNTWAARFIYAIYAHNGVAILPSVNLVSNIGFGDSATNTKDDSVLSNMKAESLSTIVHPKSITINEEADRNSFYAIYHRPLLRKIIERIKKIKP